MSRLTEFQEIYRISKYLTEDDIMDMTTHSENPIYIDDHNMFIYKGQMFKRINQES